MRRQGRVAIVLGLVAGAFLGGAWYARRTPEASAANSGRQVLYYICPMHPRYRSSQPGEAPCCGMRLEPVYAGNGAKSPASDAIDPSLPPGTIHIIPERQQLIGLRTAGVEQRAGTHTLRTTGRVAADENRLYRLNSSTELWVRKVYAPTTGSIVRKNEPLLEFYSTNFLSAAAAYLYALNTHDRHVATNMSDAGQVQGVNYQMRQAVENLQNLGVSDVDIAEIERTRKAPQLITLRSPADGIVLSRTATTGQWVGSSTELYQIADLSHVWIYADLFENEAGQVKPGMAVQVSAPHRKPSFTAKVSGVPPAFDAATRIMKVRLEAENPGLALWPDMFVDVEFPVKLPAAITVPADAVVDSGMRKTVFVDRGEGYFEPRVIETGWRFGERVEVTRGLEPDERIVVAGNFLLDSESRMRAGPSGGRAQKPKSATAVDPVCGMDVEIAGAKHKSEYQGKTYYFCAESCKKRFDQKPEGYLKKEKK